MTRTALVTGAAGFIGSHLAERLVEGGYRVVAVDSLISGDQRIQHLLRGESVVLERGDIRDEALMARIALLGPFDTVYHLAALHYIPYCAAHPVETLSVNVLGTVVLLEALKEAPPGQLVFASTGDVYAPKSEPHRETDRLGPLSIYGLSKVFGERLIAAAVNEMPATRFVVARLFNAYGSRETNPHVIPSIITQLKNRNRVRLGNMWPRRDYVHVEDMAEALVALGTTKGNGGVQYFNVGTGVSRSVQDVIEALQRILQMQVVVEVGDELVRPVERPHLQANIAKLKEAIGWRPRYELREGLRELCIHEGLVQTRSEAGDRGPRSARAEKQ